MESIFLLLVIFSTTTGTTTTAVIPQSSIESCELNRKIYDTKIEVIGKNTIRYKANCIAK